MRIGGAFQFNASGPFPITLGAGQYFYVPPGNFLMTLGSQSCLQWWDPIQYSWRNIAQPNAETLAISCDGYNYRIINMSGVVAGAAITNAGSGATTNGIGPTQTGVNVAFAAPGGNGLTAKGYAIIGGSLPALSIANAGTGFVAAPLVLIDPPPAGGIQATAVAQITAAGALASATLVNIGAGYTSLPNVYLVPQFLDYAGNTALPYTIPSSPTPVAPNYPPGQIQNLPPLPFSYGVQQAFPVTTGALVNFGAGVLGGSGTLTGIVVTDNGSLYTSAPAVSFSGGGLAGGVAATAIMSLSVTAVTGSGGVGYTIGNAVESSLGELQIGGAGLKFYNNNLLQPRQFRGVLTATTGTLVIEDNGFGFQQALVAGNFGVAQGTTIATTSIAFSGITMGGVNDTSILQAFLNE